MSEGPRWEALFNAVLRTAAKYWRENLSSIGLFEFDSFLLRIAIIRITSFAWAGGGMSISTPFVRRPVGTSLLTIALAMAGMLAFFFLPVSPLPQVDFPTISVNASLPGASPETMASSVATPLERQLGRIAGITEMTSSSSLGSTSITLQFDLNRNIDAAGRDVQAAINAARSNLPSDLPGNPTYRKVNPADAPIMILSLTSDVYNRGAMYDAASSILEQKISQLAGIGQVIVGGGALPAVRVDVNPELLNNIGLTMENVRTALATANANQAKGEFISNHRTWSITDTDQLMKADQYKPLIVTWRNGAPVRLGDIADVQDSVADIRQGGIVNGKSAVMLILFRQPGANIISTVDGVMAMLPQLQADIPAGMKLTVVLDRTVTIRASVNDVEITLLISIVLVILVVFAFLRDVRATLIPGVAVPISLIGTFGVMYLCGYSLDNLSLMALTIATGFVVDDAIVVIENITRHLEAGMAAIPAALQGAKEIGFTVVSMSTSLVAVFIPILLMGGIVGRLLREFAVVLSVAIGVSMIVSLTTTPMMCALLLKPKHASERGWLYRTSERAFDYILDSYETTLHWVLRHRFTMLIATAITVALTIYLYVIVPKGFFPQEDTGRMMGAITADQSVSFQQMKNRMNELAAIVEKDPAVDSVIAFTNGGNTARMFVSLKSLAERKLSADEVALRLRKPLSRVPGVQLILVSVQDIRVGGHSTAAQYQYTLQGDSNTDLAHWTPILLKKMKTLSGLVDVNSDQQDHGLEAALTIDRDMAGRFNIQPQTIDNILYDAFGQRQVSTMYTSLNQYHVVMEAAPEFWQSPDGLKHIYVPSGTGALVPLSTFAHYAPSTTSLSINHQGQSPAMTISFNLLPGYSLSQAVEEVQQAENDIGMPTTIHGSFQGTAQAFQASLASEPILIAAALIAVYIVLGVLYESYIHPITILSTIPSAGVGALLALLLCKTDLSIIALIGIILLIGIVKKNAILMVDFALETERRGGKAPADAIYEACLLRFRPIMMTTMAALLGAVPLAIGAGVGAEMRQPLGIAIIGGLIFSQMLTLYTTPVIYLYLDEIRLYFYSLFHHGQAPAGAHEIA
ncbi:MAG TPA: multidrug efflux RND transporter permease subunit [Tepidisphaeraceae bacterium]